MRARLGVCSWSLQARNPAELAERARACGVRWVQLALEPLRDGSWNVDETLSALHAADLGVASAMMETEGEDYSTLDTIRATGGVRPTVRWEANRRRAEQCAELARRVGAQLVTFHAGFLPHESTDDERPVLLARLREIVDVFAARGVRVGFETGQETAGTLLGVLAELRRPAAGVNFDPANMILYGMGDPAAAFDVLAPHVLQVHVKDAKPTGLPGTWGEEVPAGTGAARWHALAGRIRRRLPLVDFMIEREAGAARVDDIARARSLVEAEAWK